MHATEAQNRQLIRAELPLPLGSNIELINNEKIFMTYIDPLSYFNFAVNDIGHLVITSKLLTYRDIGFTLDIDLWSNQLLAWPQDPTLHCQYGIINMSY